MNRVFSYIVKLTPRQLLMRLWGLLLIGLLCTTVRLLSGLAFCIDLIAIVGYCYAVILGIPHTGRNSRRIGISLLVLLAAIAGFVVIALPFVPRDGTEEVYSFPFIDGWAGMAFGLAANLAIFLPFFVATHVINVTRQLKSTYKPMDFIGTFLGLYFGLFGGLIYTHRLVREIALEQGEPIGGGAGLKR